MNIPPCPHCKKPLEYLLLDAGPLGPSERDFEGMEFAVRVVRGKIVVAGKPEDADYLNGYNMRGVFSVARDVVAQELAGEQDPWSLICPECKERFA